MASKMVELSAPQIDAINSVQSILLPIEDVRKREEIMLKLRAVIIKDVERLNPGWTVSTLNVESGMRRVAYLERPDEKLVAQAEEYINGLQDKFLREED